MWFVFPELQCLGSSDMSIKFAIKDTNEAQKYWNHPVLGARLKECFEIFESHPNELIQKF